MPKNFKNELEWRGLIQDASNGFDEEASKDSVVGYIGFDPTSDSLHIGSLVQLIILKHFQQCGHKPIVLIGGATGMIGDPSGKSKERNLLSADKIDSNISSIKKQLSKFLDFDNGNSNSAVILNNYEWNSKLNIIDFFRDYGKLLTVNYMMSKESVKKRLGSNVKVGMSFTEFTYQLLQGYDFLHLYKTVDCKIQLGGSDQWGNITTGTELIRRKENGKAYAITCPLIKKSDGSKFGKTEEGNIWLDKNKTSTYKFYQFWLNTTDQDALNYIKIFTFLSREQIEQKIEEHIESPHLRILQKIIAKEITIFVHGEKAFKKAVEASQILFGTATSEALQKVDTELFLELFEGVPQTEVSMSKIKKGIDIISALVLETRFLKSNGEAKRALNENSISVNQVKVDQNYIVDQNDLIAAHYILLKRGKKSFFILNVID